MHKARAVRPLASLALAAILSFLMAIPAFAYIEEGGYKNCGSFIAYVHARFSVDGETAPPGDPFFIYWDYSSGWHTVEDNGGYAGNWWARGYNNLDTVNTWVGCRNFG